MGKSTIQILKANHGDAFIIDCYKGENHGVIVVDGGPSNMGGTLVQKFLRLGNIDLMVLTHFDDDHIGGIKKYVELWKEHPEQFPVREMWVNNSEMYPIGWNKQLSDKQGISLANVLEQISQVQPALAWRRYIYEGYIAQNIGFADIEVIGPSFDYLKREIEVLNGIRKQEDKKDNKLSSRTDRRIAQKKKDLLEPLEDLAQRPNAEPDLDQKEERANAVSISFILRCEGLSVMMLGDSYPDNIYRYLTEQKKCTPEHPIEVDYVKVAHHGSKNNSSCDLYDLIKCNNYIISTYGYRFYHPDREAIAKIVCRPRRDSSQKIHIYLNYPKRYYEGDNAFIKPGEEEAYNFKLHYEENILPL